jgi:hypothetical protein
MPELLEDDIRATAPEPDPGFVALLETRVEAGFPKPAKPPKPAKASRFRFRPVLAGAICIVLVAGFTATAVLNDNAQTTTSYSEALKPASPDSDSAAGSSVAEDAPAAIPEVRQKAARGIAPGATNRQKEIITAVELTTPEDEFSETTAGVLRVADSTGTIVQSSSVSESNGSDVARYDLRVPTSRLDDVMADLSELGKVTSRTEDVQDITSAYVSAQDRLEDARDVRKSLLKALERADSEGERSAIRARLNDARAQISAAEADIRRVKARADRAKVSVTVRSTNEQGAWMPGDAFDDAVRVLEVIAGVLLVALAILAPLGILVVAGIAAARLTRRRKREAALG